MLCGGMAPFCVGLRSPVHCAGAWDGPPVMRCVPRTNRPPWPRRSPHIPRVFVRGGGGSWSSLKRGPGPSANPPHPNACPSLSATPHGTAVSVEEGAAAQHLSISCGGWGLGVGGLPPSPHSIGGKRKFTKGNMDLAVVGTHTFGLLGPRTPPPPNPSPLQENSVPLSCVQEEDEEDPNQPRVVCFNCRMEYVPHTGYCPKCDYGMYEQNWERTMLVDITHRGQNVDQARWCVNDCPGVAGAGGGGGAVARGRAHGVPFAVPPPPGGGGGLRRGLMV